MAQKSKYFHLIVKPGINKQRMLIIKMKIFYGGGNINKYVDYVTDFKNRDFALKILENYALGYVTDYIHGKNDGAAIAEVFGNLSYLTLSLEKDITYQTNFMGRLFLKADPMDPHLAKHISNFYEIILTDYKELIYPYIQIINNNKNRITPDDMAMLYRAAIFPALKNKLQLAYLLIQIKYSYRSLSEIANYYNYYGDYGKAIYYIIKAIKTAPEDLKEDYKKKRDNIIEKINAW
ncbi:MAG: hypothetical protein LIR50_04185 [Bacillota bacterium]|nr:hypothetical protein [Bacillota bacterium]